MTRTRKRVVAGGAALLLAAALAVALEDPFVSSSPAASGVSDNGAATAIATVKRMDLSQQTEVSATLGYAGSSIVSVPSGTAPSSVEQSQQLVASAQQTLDDDQRALAQAQASLSADLHKAAVDCRGGSAARDRHRSVRDRRAGSDGGPSERHRRDGEGAGRSSGALGGIRDAEPG